MRFVLFALLTGCVVEHAATPDAGIDHHCATFTGHIDTPLPGSVQSTVVTAQYIWDQAMIPDRYTSMSDLHGNFFISSGGDSVQGDGSIMSMYALPAGGSFVLEIGWFCDAANDGPTMPLATVSFTTAP
jgi:hypothetical protein